MRSIFRKSPTDENPTLGQQRDRKIPCEMSNARPLFHPLSSGNLKYFMCLSSFIALTSGDTFASSSGLLQVFQFEWVISVFKIYRPDGDQQKSI